MNSLLHVKNLEASYGALQVLYGVDLAVQKGEIVAIVGPNGSGKSTTLKCVAGLLRPSAALRQAQGTGEITFDGEKIAGMPASRIVEHGLVMVPQGRRVLQSLTVEENLEVGGYLLSKEILKDRLGRIYRLFPVLHRKRGDQSSYLSGGEQQILSLARALILNPKLLILDEPSLGISPKTIEEIFEKLKELNREGLTILLVEQNVNLALSIADRVYVLETGKVVFEGKPKELTTPQLQALYFGHAI